MYYVATDNKGHYIKGSLSKNKDKAQFKLNAWKRKQAFQNLNPIAIENYTNLNSFTNKILGEVIEVSQDKYKQLRQKDIFGRIWIE